MNKLLCILAFAVLAIHASADNFKWALMGIGGQSFHDGLAISSRKDENTKKNLYGAIDRSGKEVVPFKFKMIEENYGGFTSGYCVASTDDGTGIIDADGNFVVGPSNDIKIRRNEKHPDLFYITDKLTDKQGLFRNGVMLTEPIYDYINDYGMYPFVSLSTKEGLNNTINVLTNDWFDGYGAVRVADKIVLTRNGNYLYYTDKGERIASSKLAKSSQGVEVFKDSSTGLYGLRKGVSVIVEPKYKSSYCGPAWIHDMIVLTDSVSPEVSKSDILFDANGKTIFSRPNVTTSIYFYKSSISYQGKESKTDKGVLNLYGEEIAELKGQNTYETYAGWINHMADETGPGWTYSIKSGKRYPAVFANPTGEVLVRYYDNKWYVINPVIEKMFGPYDLAGKYNEGLIMVKKGSTNIFLSKDGAEYPLPSGWDVTSDGFSEGVCYARDTNSGLKGYIYNPLGTNYVYNQEHINNDDRTIREMMDNALQATIRGEHGYAQDMFYKIMMIDPTNTQAINNYAASLYHLGHLDEALAFNQRTLDIDSSNQHALSFRQDLLQAIEQRDHPTQENEFKEASSGTSFWNALSAFGNRMASCASAFTGGDGMSYGNYSSHGSSSTTGRSSGNYESQYRQWERLAQRHYNSITNTGGSFRRNDGSRSGTAGRMSVSNYTSMKRSYREAQNEMRQIRQRAAREGIQIPQSQWETNTISF